MRVPLSSRDAAMSLLALVILFGMGSFTAGDLSGVVVVATAGDEIPGRSGTVGFMQAPVINDAGEALFPAQVVQGNISGGIFRASEQGLALLVAGGDPSPDGNGQFESLTGKVPFANDSGAVALQSFMNGSLGGFQDAFTIVAGRGGGEPLRIVARGHQPVPGDSGARFFAPTPRDFNQAGQVVFADTTTDGRRGLWRGDGAAETMTKIVAEGDANPRGDGDMTVQVPLSAVLNRSGQVAFIDLVTSGGNSLVGLYRGAGGGSLSAIVREGDPVPSGDGVFRGVDAVSGLSINDHGDIAFVGILTGTSKGAANDIAVFRAAGASPLELVREGDAVPDGDGSFLFTSTPAPILMNSSGSVLFWSRVTGASSGAEEGIFLVTTMTIEQVARLDQPAPGGGAFSSFSNSIALNDEDQVAFVATVDVGGFVDPTGIFLYEDGRLVDVAREGDVLPGFGALTTLTASAGLQGAPRSSMRFLNDHGQIAFRFFTASSGGIAIATPDVCRDEEDLHLSGISILAIEVHKACNRVVAADLTVEATGDLTLRAGRSVVLGNGLTVAAGGRLTIRVD